METFFNKRHFFIAALAAGLLPAAAGGWLLICAPELAEFIGKKSWDAIFYYSDQLRFLGRMGIALSLLWYGALISLKKGCRLTSVLIVSALAAGVILQIDSFIRREMWNDTISLALWLRDSSWQDLLLPGGSNPYCQSAPPGFILVSKIAGTAAGYSKWALTLLPLLFGLGSLFVFALLSARLLPLPGRTAAIWLFALNPGLWFYAGEFKQYTADIFFTVTIMLLAADFSGNEEKRSKQLLLWGITGLFFSHAMFFLLPATAGALWLRSGFTFNRAFLKLAFTWAAAVLAMALYTKLIMPRAMYVHEHHAAGFAPLPLSGENLKWYFNTAVQLFAAPWNMLWKGSWLVLFPLTGMICGSRELRQKGGTLLWSFLFILLMLLLCSMLRQYPLAAGLPFAKGRLILFTIPLAIIVFCASVTCRKAMIWLIPVFAGALLNFCTAFMPFSGFRSAVNELVKVCPPEEKVLINGEAGSMALKLYAPRNHFKKVAKVSPENPEAALGESQKVYILLTDIPTEKFIVPANFTLSYKKDLPFASVMTLEKKE